MSASARQAPSARARRACAGLGIVYGVCLLIVLLAPQPPIEPRLASTSAVWAPGWLADALLNVTVFVPVGVLGVLAGVRPGRVVVAAALLSVAAEIAQLAIPGRFASLLDPVSNTTGALVGVALPLLRATLRAADPPRRRQVALGASLAAALAFSLPAWLLTPSHDESTWFGLWAPERPGLARFEGVVSHASIGGVEVVESGRVPDSGALHAQLAAGAPLVIRGRAGTNTAGLAPVLLVVDEAKREQLLVATHDADLVLLQRTRAARFGLRNPSIVARHALAAMPPGRAFEARIDLGASPVTLSLNGVVTPLPALPASRGWALLRAPTHYPEALTSLLDVVWVGLWLGPAAWLSRRDRRASVGVAMAAAVLVLAPLIGDVAIAGPGALAMAGGLWLACFVGEALTRGNASGGDAADAPLDRLERSAPR